MMGAGNVLGGFLMATVVAIPMAAVLGTAALLTAGGLIGCTRCAVGALQSIYRQRSTESGRVIGGQLAH
ncbi:MAG TPA: hypothetical protein VF902_05940 [Coriobacteriia bacterium]